MSARFNHNRVLKETIEGPYSVSKTESDAGGKWGGKFIYVYGFVYLFCMQIYKLVAIYIYKWIYIHIGPTKTMKTKQL